MSTITVTTQEELDAALAAKAETIYIESPAGVRLEITDSGGSTVHAWDSSHVHARDGSTVHARDGSRVHARGGSHVHARDGSTVHAWDSSHVDAWDGSTVHAWDSSHVHVRDGSHVHAQCSSHVHAWDGSTLRAWKYVGVHLHSQQVTLTGDGHVIDLTEIDFSDPLQWCEFHGVEVADGIAYVYKAVGDDWKSGYGTRYEPGSTPEAPDWNTIQACGNGLHFCARPLRSLEYKRDATRFVKCGVRLNEMVTLGDKIKARRVVVPCVEVDPDGVLVQGAA